MSNKQNNHIVDTNKKISSVEWLIEMINDHDCLGQAGYYTFIIPEYRFKEIKEQAKAMHKEEIETASNESCLNSELINKFGRNKNKSIKSIGEQYYQQTYGND